MNAVGDAQIIQSEINGWKTCPRTNIHCADRNVSADMPAQLCGNILKDALLLVVDVDPCYE